MRRCLDEIQASQTPHALDYVARRSVRTGEADIAGDGVIVSVEEVPNPMAVRFAWDEAAQPNLINAAGLPAGAFRTEQPW